MNLTVGLWRPAVATEDFNSQGNQDIEKQVPKDDGVDLRKKGTTRKTILQNLNPEGKYLQMWNMMFVVSCTIAVSVDPLFFYLPVIKEDNKCLALDDKLKITVICLRSVTDMIYVLNIILQFLCPVKLARTMIIKDAWPIAKRYLLSYFLMDILAILPIPQVLVPIIFSEMREPPNTTLFDFGIFLDALQSGTVASKDFPRKFAYRFWWGLRNLSSVGQNLQTSTYIWETLFAVLISICGLLLFLYFIGNLQTYMQLATQRSEDIIQSVKFKERDVDLWIHRNELPLDIKKEIMSDITQILEQKKDVDVEKPLPHLHWELRKKIKDHLCKPLLRKVPLLEKNEQLSQLICDHLKPVYYNEQNYIVREGEPLDAMLFITQGIVWNFITTSDGEGIVTSKAQCIEKELPISTETAKTHTKVEGFALMANDLRTLVSKWKNKEVSSIQAAWRRHHLEKKNEKSNQLVLGNKNCLSSSFSCFKNTCSFSFFKNTSKSSSA
nr:cyclic nucleotide-gated ion channel 1 [Quercus suber]